MAKRRWQRRVAHRKWSKKQLLSRDGDICKLCGRKFLRMKDITIDHIVPTSQGGLDLIENYQLAHLECNRSKSSLSMEEWNELQGLTTTSTLGHS